jgi:hypothetical protein
MAREETIEKFIYAFPKLFFFIRPHHRRTCPKKRDSTRNINDEVTINQIQFNVLWLIDLLIGSDGEGGWCSERSLKDVFLWRQPDDENQLNGVISKLRDAGLIESRKNDLGDSRGTLIALTPEGRLIVEELKGDRKQTASDIFDLLGLADDESAEAFVAAFTDVAERAWRAVEAQAKKQAKK